MQENQQSIGSFKELWQAGWPHWKWQLVVIAIGAALIAAAMVPMMRS